MKGWQMGLLIVFTLGVAYVLLKRPSVTAPAGTSASTSNALLNLVPSILNFGGKLIGDKPAPTAAVPADTSIGLSTDTGQAATTGVDPNNAATYVPGESLTTYSTSIFGPGTEG